MWLQIVGIVLQIIAYLIKPKTKIEDTAPGVLTGTSVDPSSPVPILFGTRLMKQPNLVWYGDIATTPIVSKGGGKK